MHDKMMKMLMSKKKEGKTLSDSEKKSKLQALTGMRDMATHMMGDKLKNLKKVTVAAQNKPDLKKGLHQAEDLIDQSPQDLAKPDSDPNNMNQGGKVGQLPSEFDRDEDHIDEEHNKDAAPRQFNEGGDSDEESPEHEASESPEFEAGENEESMEKILSDSPNDPEKLEELIKKLEEKKQQLSK